MRVDDFVKSNSGLSSQEVALRIEKGQVNKTHLVVGKSYLRIIVDNVFNLFNLLLFAIAGLMIYGGYWSGLFFLFVLVPNILIGLYEDITARRLMGKLHLKVAPRAQVIRDGSIKEILSEELVKDDLVYFSTDAQISADCIILEGNISVNEAQISGESRNVYKKVGDILYSGSFVTSGEAICRVDKVGKDSYVEQIHAVAKQFKRSKSEILSSLHKMFRVIRIAVICIAAAIFVTYSCLGYFYSEEAFKSYIPSISGSMVAMIPSGLYLLTSVCLATAVIALANKHAHVQDFYSVEMLARTDVICVDKTGTITDGTLTLKEIISLGELDEHQIKAKIFDLMTAVNDHNHTAKALLDVCSCPSAKQASKILSFSSENKYSAATFNGTTYIIGAFEFINVSNKNEISKKCEKYISKGYRVLLLAHGNSEIKGNAYNDKVEADALIVLKDHIKDDAKETFTWFQNSGVAIKVISGDNAVTASEVAKEAGIENADLYISLENVKDEEIPQIADKYTVFGRVSPNQKALLVDALQKLGHHVAMTGDGVNDIVALKKADCSIAMASGSEAARNVSHIVLMNSNFANLPDVVAEGRRVINNIQRTSSLFLVKTMFAFFFTIAFLIGNIINHDVTYPFVTNHLYLWEIASIGLPAFFLALEKNQERLEGRFLSNTLIKAIPGAIAFILGILIIFGMYHLQHNNVMYTGVATLTQAIAISVLFMSTIGLIVLAKISWPFSKYRLIVVICAALVVIGGLGIAAALSFNASGNIFLIDFTALDGVQYLIYAVVTVLMASLYLFANYIYEVIQGKHLEDDK